MYNLKILNFKLPIILFTIQICLSFSCTKSEKLNRMADIGSSPLQYSVYIINNNLHTGIVIPVNSESVQIIGALKYFGNFRFTDIGWGEEKFYQDPEDNYCMAARAIFLPNTSVLRVEGYSTISDSSFIWSDFTVRLTLSSDQFIKLIKFIDESFRKDKSDELIIASKRHSGEVIFFKSVYRYYLFNTCNTWVAKALNSAGFDISPLFIITASQLYNKIKDQGTVLKSIK